MTNKCLRERETVPCLKTRLSTCSLIFVRELGTEMVNIRYLLTVINMERTWLSTLVALMRHYVYKNVILGSYYVLHSGFFTWTFFRPMETTLIMLLNPLDTSIGLSLSILGPEVGEVGLPKWGRHETDHGGPSWRD